MPQSCRILPIFLAILAIQPDLNPARAASNSRQSKPKKIEGRHWSFEPILNPAVPQVSARERARTPIDMFILRRLEANSLSLSPPASRVELIRRAKIDLLGLSPTPAEIDAFDRDSSVDAYERLVDRLLADPHYGESWGRMWLDLVRFAETAGYNADPVRPLAWKFRDYVVRAFNADVPYNRFVCQQLAGDEMFPDDVDAQIATGYLRMWPDESNASVVALARQDALNDLTGNVGAVFLGLSIGCAQCHDHKFDPIKQHDFYRLQAFFAGIVPVEQAPVGSSGELAEYRRRLDRWETKTQAVRDELFRLTATARARAASERRKRFPADVLAAIDTPPDERTALERQLFFWSDRQIGVTEKQILAQMSPPDRKRLAELRKRVAQLEAGRPQPPISAQVMATAEVPGPIPATYLLAGGSYDKPLREVRPGFLSALSQAPEPAAKVVPPLAGVSGRRSALARWMTDSENPLVARVIVNRIWQGHFGRGLIDNANDFGTQTAAPTHPELLDWLARQFVASGWDIKALHRLIMTSEVYRQASYRRRADEPIPQAAKIDGENRLYWRHDRRRMTAEQIRDSILAVSGRLNEQLAGPGVRPPLPKSFGKSDAWRVTKSRLDQDRRSVYIFAKRNLPFPLLKAFDLPDMHESCARRTSTIIAPQALALFNNDFVVDCGNTLAGRILREDPSDDWRSHIARAYRTTFGRTPADDEVTDALNFLRVQAARIPPEHEHLADDGAAASPDEKSLRTAFADLCHTLLNANEFLFVE
jgi:Protein of unknown function (DUF1553)/Protein of unknown function (DUF1549)